jgi:hypothetical protein
LNQLLFHVRSIKMMGFFSLTRFIQQWVFKGRCVDLYKEFMIFENDVYLAYRGIDIVLK